MKHAESTIAAVRQIVAAMPEATPAIVKQTLRQEYGMKVMDSTVANYTYKAREESRQHSNGAASNGHPPVAAMQPTQAPSPETVGMNVLAEIKALGGAKKVLETWNGVIALSSAVGGDQSLLGLLTLLS